MSMRVAHRIPLGVSRVPKAQEDSSRLIDGGQSVYSIGTALLGIYPAMRRATNAR